MKLLATIRSALEATGLPWSLEPGGKHIKIKVNGRLVGILPRGSARDRDRANLNTIAQIKRTARK